MLVIQKTKGIAAYLCQLCTAELQSNSHVVSFPNWPIDLLEECHYAAKVIVQAIAYKKSKYVLTTIKISMIVVRFRADRMVGSRLC